MADVAHVDDIGVLFEATVKSAGVALDISGATTKDFIFGRPDGTKLTVSTVFKTDGSDGIIQYTTVSGDLNVPGTWGIQAHIIRPSKDHHTSKERFPVDPNI